MIVAWVDERSPTTAIYAQRLNAAGGALWLPDGSPAEPSAGSAWLPRVIAGGGAYRGTLDVTMIARPSESQRPVTSARCAPLRGGSP